MIYRHSFRVRAPLSSVADFHADPASMGRITPPPIRVEVHSAPLRITDGVEMDFTLHSGPLPIHWVARFEEVSPTGFTDRQLRGPFATWVHRHSFIAVDAGVTEVVDEVSASFKLSPLWGAVGAAMWAGMPALFAFRARQTRAALETGAAEPPARV